MLDILDIMFLRVWFLSSSFRELIFILAGIQFLILLKLVNFFSDRSRVNSSLGLEQSHSLAVAVLPQVVEQGLHHSWLELPVLLILYCYWNICPAHSSCKQLFTARLYGFSSSSCASWHLAKVLRSPLCRLWELLYIVLSTLAPSPEISSHFNSPRL